MIFVCLEDMTAKTMKQCKLCTPSTTRVIIDANGIACAMQVSFVSTFAELYLFVAVSRVEVTPDVLGVLKHLAENAAENAAAIVYKRLKYTQTPLQTAREAGKALLDSSQLCGPELVHTLLGDMADMTALDIAVRSVKAQMEDCPVDGNTVQPVQKLVVRLFTDLQSSSNLDGSAAMVMWDTHVKGVTVSDSSIRAKPDLLLCDTYTEAANVVTVVEATNTLAEAHNRVDIAFQLQQRVEQLQRSQPRRSFWVLAAVGNTSVEIWHIKQVCALHLHVLFEPTMSLLPKCHMYVPTLA